MNAESNRLIETLTQVILLIMLTEVRDLARHDPFATISAQGSDGDRQDLYCNTVASGRSNRKVVTIVSGRWRPSKLGSTHKQDLYEEGFSCSVQV